MGPQKHLKTHVSQMDKPKCAVFVCLLCEFDSSTPDILYANLKFRHVAVKNEATKVHADIFNYDFVPFCKVCQFWFDIRHCECQNGVPITGASKDWKPRPFAIPPAFTSKMNTIDTTRLPTNKRSSD